MKSDYYVYTYVDPRSFEEFYYGKGKGSRKNAHLFDRRDTEKSRRIVQIRKAGLEPLVRIIAADLTEREALLVEATLLWKLGKWTTNITGGHFSDNFRPPNTLYLDLPGFDFRNKVYYFNVGEGESRNWDDCRKYGFIAAGGGARWRDAILGFNPGDIFFAYLRRHGYVGVGRIKERAQMARDVRIKGKKLLDLKLVAEGMDRGLDDAKTSEYVAVVQWLKTVPREDAKWKKKAGLFTTEVVRASLEKQPKTIRFVEHEFDIDIAELGD